MQSQIILQAKMQNAHFVAKQSNSPQQYVDIATDLSKKSSSICEVNWALTELDKPGWRANAIWAAYETLEANLTEYEFSIFIDLRTRVEMVEKLTEIKFVGYRPGTSKAYEALLKVALAWSALDRVMALTGRKDNFNIIYDPLSTSIKAGRFEKMIESLKSLKSADANNKGLLNDIGRGKASTKLNRLAKAIRNSMFHGALNPTRVGLIDAPRKQDLLLGLSGAILDACLSEFERWVKAR